MEQLDGLLHVIADAADGMSGPAAGTAETDTDYAKLRAADRLAVEEATAARSLAQAEASAEKQRQLEATLGWACESCMTLANPAKAVRCKTCSTWRSDAHRRAYGEEAARQEAELVAEAARLVAEREAEEAARVAALEEALKTTRDERVAAMLGRLCNRRMYDCITNWVMFVEAACVERDGEELHEAHYRLGKRCKVAPDTEFQKTVTERYVHVESRGVGASLDPESLLAAWRGKPSVYEALCGTNGVIVAISAEERAVELQFVADLHGSAPSAFWLPIEVCVVEGAPPLKAKKVKKRRTINLEPEPKPEPEQIGFVGRGVRPPEMDEREWAEHQKHHALAQELASIVIQARWRGFTARMIYGPELERTRGWTEHDYLMETINRLERGTNANFNLQFPNAQRGAEDPAVSAVREEWQATIGDGQHWSEKMIAYHVSGALDESLGLLLSGDTMYLDGIIRRRLSPEDAERMLTVIQVEVRRRQRLGLEGARAVAEQGRAAAAGEDDIHPEEEPKKKEETERSGLLEGEYEERHLVETVKQCVKDLILELEKAEHPKLVSERAMDNWSRTRVIADRIAAAAAKRALGEAGSWFQPDSTRWLGRLELDKLRLTDLGAGVIATALPSSNLHTLILHECGIGSEGVMNIASVLHNAPALELLDLRGNGAVNAGIRAIAAGVTHPGCGLRDVALSFNMTAKEWSSKGLEDSIRCLHSVIPHSRLTSLKLDFKYEVISRARPFLQKKMLKLHAVDFGSRRDAPLPDWLQVGGSGASKHWVTDEMRARLWANLRRASHAARQRLAWVVVASRVPILAALGGVVHKRLQLAVAERTRRDACTTATGGAAGTAATGHDIPVAHHYITRRSVLAREGIEVDSRPLRVLEEGEIIAGLEVRCDRRSGGEPRLRFIYASPPMIGVQGWAVLSVSLPPGPTKSEVEAAAAAEREAAKQRRAETEANAKGEEERWKRQMVALEQAVVDARKLPLGDEMMDAMLAAEKAVLAANKEHELVAADLAKELAAPPPKALAPPSHRSWQLGRLEGEQVGGGDSLAIRRALNVEGDLLTPMPGSDPVPGDGRAMIRKQQRRQRQLTCTTALANAMVEHRNTLPPEGYGDTQADYLFVISADGRWPVQTSRRVNLLSYTEDSKVKFHSRLRVVAADCLPVERRPGPTLPVTYRPDPDHRNEALFAELARWQRHKTVQELSKWLLDDSALSWPAGWACVRVADVLSVVEAEGELVNQNETLSELNSHLQLQTDTMTVLDKQLVDAAEVLEAKHHTHELASIEAKYYNGEKLDGTHGDSSPTTVLVTATEKLRAQEEDRAVNRQSSLQEQRDDAESAAAEAAVEIAEREKRVKVLEHGLASCVISDSVDLDWEKTLVECHADEKPNSLQARWDQEEREAEESDPELEAYSAAAESEASDADAADLGEQLEAALTNAVLALEDQQAAKLRTPNRDKKKRRRKKKKPTGRPVDAGRDVAASVHEQADFQHGEGGLLGEALSLRAGRLDARLPALQRHTELLPLPISSHHVNSSTPRFGTPGGAQPRPRRMSASPSRMLVPLAPKAAVGDAAADAAALTLAPATPERPARKRVAASPLFGR